jgi:integrase
MELSYDVRIWKTTVYRGQHSNTHYVRWAVGGRARKSPFKSAALAESFRSELVAAARRGEAFDMESGTPISMARTAKEISWYQLACDFADSKWPRVAATTRRTHAEGLTAITTALLTTARSKPDEKLIRLSLCRWAFNTQKRRSEHTPAEVKTVLRWVDAHSKPVSALTDPGLVRRILDSLTRRLDGAPAAASVVSRRRKIFSTALTYAVEQQILSENPLSALRWTPPQVSFVVDRRSVVNPAQARRLLDAVRTLEPSGPRLVAFFGCLYFSALRPEEAVALRRVNLDIPERGWGELILEKAEPHAGREWTDTGSHRDSRQLKQRARGEVRRVPCPPELTALLQEHLALFGVSAGGRLFVGERNQDQLPIGTINRNWKRAREVAFSPELVASQLAETPYALRHAAVSTWLSGGVPATTVARWAGHSIDVLHRIYAKCLDGEEHLLRHRVEQALSAQHLDTHLAQTLVTDRSWPVSPGQ